VPTKFLGEKSLVRQKKSAGFKTPPYLYFEGIHNADNFKVESFQRGIFGVVFGQAKRFDLWQRSTIFVNL